jgi:hypothetical protein
MPVACRARAILVGLVCDPTPIVIEKIERKDISALPRKRSDGRLSDPTRSTRHDDVFSV